MERYSPCLRTEGRLYIARAVDRANSEGKRSRKPYADSCEDCFWDDAFGLQTLFCEVEGGVEAGEHELGRGERGQVGDAVWPAVGAVDEFGPD